MNFLHGTTYTDDLTLLGALMLNTGGLIVLIRKGKTKHNHTSDGIRQPADGSSKPST